MRYRVKVRCIEKESSEPEPNITTDVRLKSDDLQITVDLCLGGRGNYFEVGKEYILELEKEKE